MNWTRKPTGQTILFALASATSQVVVAIMYLVAARLSGPSDFGIAATIIAISYTVVGVVDFGASSYWIRELSSGRLLMREMVERSLSKNLWLAAILTVLIVVTSTLLRDFSLWWVGALAIGISLSLSTQVALRSSARSDLLARSILISKLIMALCMAYLLVIGVAASTALILTIAIGSVGEAALNMLATARVFRGGRPTRLVLNPWSGATNYGLSSTANAIQSVDLPLLAALAGTAPAGIYGSVNRWTQPLGLLASAFASTSVPFMAAARSLRGSWSAVRNAAWMLYISLFASGAMILLAPQLVPVLLGGAYTDAVPVLQVLALGTIPAILNQPMAVALQTHGMDRAVAVITTSSAFARLAIVASFAVAMGALAASWAFAITQMFASSVYAFLLLRGLRKEDS
ncbi:lipopolysaccharide biosynthesis protein [Microcella alkalica]|uniref:lipopolysaccharide biosynthesis protein n=1 Tax=Microcella alkalica TaxID=355930 RepID=UPI00145CBCBD|nr:hypothetical protein [Microcella alkalica]